MSRLILPLVVLALVGNPTLPGASDDMQALLDRFKALEDFTRLVEREFYRPVTREQLWDGALRGMMEGLDRHSRYLSPEEVVLRNRDPEGPVLGFGFDWYHDAANERALVSRVIPGSPAAAGGLVRGAVIEALDDHELQDLNLVEIRNRFMRLGDDCTLRLRQADGMIEEVTLVRATIDHHGVADATILAPQLGIGYLAIHRFVAGSQQRGRTIDTSTAHAFREAVDGLRDQGLKALIIDLRGNGGGHLQSAVAIADAFLNHHGDGTLIVAQVSRNPTHQARHMARSDNTYPHWPLAVLIDAHTASSAEILAGALQDHRRAVVVGQTSAGKTAIQQQFMLPGNSAVLLTVAHYHGARERRDANRALMPDVAVPQDRQQHLHRARTRHTGAPDPLDDTIRRAVDMLTATVIHTGF